jgi:hypothetical protein
MPSFGRRRRLFTVALGVAVSSLVCSGVAAASPSPPPSLNSAQKPIGPVIDPFSQRTNAAGVYANAPDPGEKGTAPPEDLKKYPKGPIASATNSGAAGNPGSPISVANEGQVVSTDPGPDGVRVTFYEPVPGITPAQLVADLHSQGTASARVVQNLSELAGTASDSAVSAGPNDCTLGAAVWSWCPVKTWANNGYVRPIMRINDHTSSLWDVNDQVGQMNRAPRVDTKYLWNSCPFQAGARCIDAWSGNYGPTSWVGITSIWVTNSYTIPEAAPAGEQPNGLWVNEFWDPAGSPTGCGPTGEDRCLPFNRDNVILHELGHLWGLDHASNPTDFMYSSTSATTGYIFIGSDSYNLLNQVYSVPR